MSVYLNKAMHAAHDLIARGLVDRKLLIKAGWLVYHRELIPTAGAVQVAETEQAFYAGAQHLLGAIMGSLDEGDDATDDDLRRMANIQAELDEFGERLGAKMLQPKPAGSA